MLVHISRNELTHAGGTYPRDMTATEIGLPPDVAALEAELRSAIRGEVRFDRGSRALYSTDASNYRQVPIGVVIPRDKYSLRCVETLSVTHVSNPRRA